MGIRHIIKFLPEEGCLARRVGFSTEDVRGPLLSVGAASGDGSRAGIGGSYLGAEVAALLACVMATLLVLLPPLPPLLPPPLFLLVPVAIFAVLVLLVLVPCDARGVASTTTPYSSYS
ncbi:hypothetical protein SETIT_8G123600v2 [Setaria italica]|uniref:Uncharacterized protein n=2 Tax=Setaria TaxID=4554 RepID=A0A368S6Z7_SETIT|nr:hypothetical protein SETIT_8G123600v2 [Setaria italica]TKW00726.1 hypothetical protein SEVIR_8G130600v2 [Setaria viridis]